MLLSHSFCMQVCPRNTHSHQHTNTPHTHKHTQCTHNTRNIASQVTATASNAGFVPDFLFQGTRDETAFCCVPTALKLYRELGAERIRAYNGDLVARASALLAKMWDTEILAPPSLRGAFMAAIRVPFPFSAKAQAGTAEAAAAAVAMAVAGGPEDHEELGALLRTPLSHNLLREMLQRQFQIEYVKLFNFGKRVWVRISCQIYNQIEDYQRLGHAVGRIVGSDPFYSELKKRARIESADRPQLSQVSQGDGRW